MDCTDTELVKRKEGWVAVHYVFFCFSLMTSQISRLRARSGSNREGSQARSMADESSREEEGDVREN